LATDRLTRPGAAHADRRDRPFATGGQVGAALRLSGVNAAAQRAGLGPGMTWADARAVCPEVALAPARPEDDLALLDRLADWALRYTPWTALEGLDATGGGGLWLDITGCAHLFATAAEPDGERPLIADLSRRLAALGLTARAGLADGKGAAWAAARFLDPDQPHGLMPEGAARQILPSLPVAALRLDAATLATLERLGLRRVGDLLDLPRAPLAARFGRVLAQRLDQALGRHPEPFAPRRPPAPYRARLGFPEPIGRQDDVAAGLDRLLAALCGRLERDGRGARHLILEAFRVDARVERLSVGTARPVRDPRHLARLFAETLGGLDAGFGIESLVLSIPRADSMAETQGHCLDAAGQGLGQDKDLSLFLDRLGSRLGAGAVLRPVAHASHLPEKAVRPLPPLAPLPPGAAGWPRRPRPPRLLPRPEPVEDAGRASGGPPPDSFRWRRHRLTVTRADGPERIAAEWWHGSAPPGPRAVRDYWRVEDAEGRRLWLFHSGGSWFVHGVLP
jgi:protein ImuB